MVNKSYFFLQDDLAALDLPNPPASKSSQVIQNLFK